MVDDGGHGSDVVTAATAAVIVAVVKVSQSSSETMGE